MSSKAFTSKVKKSKKATFKKVSSMRSTPTDYATIQDVRRLIMRDHETKESYPNAGSASLSATGTVTLLNGVAQGSDLNNRIGRQVNHKQLQLNCAVSSGLTNTLPLCGFWAVVMDTDEAGALPAFGDIFDTANGLADFAFALRNTFNQKERFIILKMEEFVLNPTSAECALSWREYIPLDKSTKLKPRNKIGVYDGTTSAVADVGKNALYFVSCKSNNAAFGSAQTGSIIMNAKYQFTDA
jgi:Satellite tobacco necrosis virus coat protein.